MIVTGEELMGEIVHLGRKEQKILTIMVAALVFFSSLFPFSVSRREGRKGSPGQTEEQHACFSGLLGKLPVEIQCWHISQN